MTAESRKIAVIITGATGMVGEAALLECLENPAVDRVLMVNRKPQGTEHPKLKELLVPDFMNLGAARQELSGYDACFYCAGVSSVGMTEADYTRITYDTALSFARELVDLNPHMVLVHVSGGATDSTERGRVMWARVKGKAENDLLKLPFKAVYNFRPGFMKPFPGQRNIKGYYKFIAWLYPVLHALAPNYASTLQGVARAMINAVLKGYPKGVLEIVDLNTLAEA